MIYFRKDTITEVKNKGNYMPRKDIYKSAKPFTKGDPRINRNGRPRGADFKKLLVDWLEEPGSNKESRLLEMIAAVYSKAIAGDIRAAELLLRRAYPEIESLTNEEKEKEKITLIWGDIDGSMERRVEERVEERMRELMPTNEG